MVIEDKRQLCVAQQARDVEKPWLWWDYVARYSSACTMANGWVPAFLM